jgi:hypothetical protein
MVTRDMQRLICMPEKALIFVLYRISIKDAYIRIDSVFCVLNGFLEFVRSSSLFYIIFTADSS